MTGVVFIVSVPSKENEDTLKKKCKRRIGLNRTTSSSSKLSTQNEEATGTSAENMNPVCRTSSISSECMNRLEAYVAQYCEDADSDDAKSGKPEYFMEEVSSNYFSIMWRNFCMFVFGNS